MANAAINELQKEMREMKTRLTVLERLTAPTRMRRGILEWLRETAPKPTSYLDRVRQHSDHGNLLIVLQRQGIASAMMALWTKVYQPDDPDCPIRSYNIAPLNLYGFDGLEWKKIGPIDFGALHQITEQWFYRAIRAEHAEGSETATTLLQKILNSASDNSKLRARLSAYLRRTLKEVKIFEFEP